MNKPSEGHASSVRILKDVAELKRLADIECTCSAADMPHGTCCKVRTAFEQWYDAQANGLLMPFDAFKGGWIEARAAANPAAILELLAQRDELAKALKDLMELESRSRFMPIGKEWDEARAAIAKVSP